MLYQSYYVIMYIIHYHQILHIHTDVMLAVRNWESARLEYDTAAREAERSHHYQSVAQDRQKKLAECRQILIVKLDMMTENRAKVFRKQFKVGDFLCYTMCG